MKCSCYFILAFIAFILFELLFYCETWYKRHKFKRKQFKKFGTMKAAKAQAMRDAGRGNYAIYGKLQRKLLGHVKIISAEVGRQNLSNNWEQEYSFDIKDHKDQGKDVILHLKLNPGVSYGFNAAFICLVFNGIWLTRPQQMLKNNGHRRKDRRQGDKNADKLPVCYHPDFPPAC